MSTRLSHGDKVRLPPGSPPADPRMRFLKRLPPRPTDGSCWEWTGAKWKGYGQFGIQRRPGVWGTVKAHRFAYEMFVGPIPDGLQLDHLCRNPACVNPDHLEPVTNRENGLRGVSPAAIHAKATHCINGHEFTPENTMIRTGTGWPTRECRACYRQRMQAERDTQTGVTPWQCTECGRFMRSLKGLRVHLMKVHNIDGKAHGSRSMYMSGCRCELCRHSQRRAA